ncbi:TonB-dependent receptor [Tenacibaculum finnmarkense]|uniref:TonB-dependent receptor plug domain-containing protein n=1 Tax=Tenacibaculum finnmarkense TaxID=2781243 RepID=UPI001EFA3D01|nr:TonB-dependent receptor plug domain-containing protein [Tenacibaculum finnmarkense]MCG8805012.1 TonB-dependent receptor [Tenacibaculum finnmarkense]MCG8855559.1 TonB-dependent receptor [Tenacibaculum finnmarkense]WCC47049.1 TonB-dependent receptor plug domain-containing protein [Tenacibaculum finnmarkense]
MFKKYSIIIVFAFFSMVSYAQVEVKGLVYDEYLEPFYNAKITVLGESTLSDQDGNFALKVFKSFPITLRVSAFGYQTEELVVEGLDKSINIILKEAYLLDQVVISASRVPERIIESPVTIERFGLNDIKNTTSNSFYDGLANIKGVQSREAGYGFKSVNTRGFSDFSNSRFIQMIDGMDTAAPALNFSPGNLSGVSDLDINNVEILPGASSALYGANAYNGLMLLTTKNPFEHTGISVLLKSGNTSQKTAGNNTFYDASVRMAYKFSESLAAKVNFNYLTAEEWHANDTRNKQIDTNKIIEGTRDNTLNFDGINIYGDEFNYSSNLLDSAEYFGENFNDAKYDDFDFSQDFNLSRTGYSERELLDNDQKIKNLKFDASIHYRPFKDESLELIVATKISTGNSLFQGMSRYAQRESYVNQSKFEVKGSNFYVRAYYSLNDAGDSFDLNRTGSVMTSALSSIDWGDNYFNNLNNALNDRGLGFEDFQAYPELSKQARLLADSYRFQPGTPEFNKELKRIKSTLITKGGSKIYDKSAYSHAEGNYNFSSLLDNWGDVQVGGSFRQYNPNSRGTIFNDATEAIQVNEYGIYSQVQKKFLEKRLGLTGSLRYDKSQNFDGNYSPRLAVNYALGEDKNHFIRASYQTGFRNPTIQEQYLMNQPGRKVNLGTSKDNLDRISIGRKYDELNNINYTQAPLDGIISGNDIMTNSLLTSSVYPSADYEGKEFVKSAYSEVKPEEVQTIELGYRSMFGITKTNNINLDINAFYSKHKDFVFRQDIITPKVGLVYPFGNRKLTTQELADPIINKGKIVDGVLVADELAQYALYNVDNDGELLAQEFNLVTNSKSKVTSYGFGIGLNTKLLKTFNFGVNYNFINYEIIDKDLGFFEPNFNTPKHTVKVQLGNNNVFNNFGFNINARWQDEYRWVSTFVKGDVSERTVIDAQLNYRIPSMKSKIKIGGTNLFGKEYIVAPGSGQIGQLYYVSWTINN